MHIYTSSFFKFRNKANFYSFLGASAGTGAPRNTQKIGTQCGCEYGYKNYESFGSLPINTVFHKHYTYILIFVRFITFRISKNIKDIT